MAYTKLALTGLNGAWSGATVGFQLTYDAHPATLAIALVSSALAGIGTLWWASRRLFKTAPKDLLVGEAWINPKAVKRRVVRGNAGSPSPASCWPVLSRPWAVVSAIRRPYQVPSSVRASSF